MLQVRLVFVAVVLVPALEARAEIAGAWFLVTVTESVAADPMPFEQESAKVFAPLTSETLTPLVAELPLTVQVGAG